MAIWALALAIIFALLIYFLYKYGVFDRFQMHQDFLDNCQALYISYRGPYQAVGKQFDSLDTKTSGTFSISNSFGFYYDNPQNTKPEDCRAVIGIIVNKGEQFKIKKFRQQHPEFRQRHLKTTKCLAYYMPFINSLSLLLMVKKVYPLIDKYIKKQGIDFQKAAYGIMEIYRFGRAQKQIDIILCLQNKQQFDMYYEDQNQRENGNKMFLEKDQ